MKTRRDILAGAPTLAVAVAAASAAVAQPSGGGAGALRDLGPTELRDLLATGRAATPEDHGAVGDGVADDTDAIAAWLLAPLSPKVAPPGRTYRVTRPMDISGADAFDVDFSGSTLRLEHSESVEGDELHAYGLHLPARHALRNVTVEGLGGSAMQSGILTPAATGGDIVWENVWFRNLQRRGFHVRTDNFLGIGFIRVTDCQTFPGGLPEGYNEGAGKFNCRNFTVGKLWGEGGSKRCFAFGDPDFEGKREAIESGFVAHVYVPHWETLGYSGQALYCNFANNITFARVDVLDYHCDVSSQAVYFSRDCRDVTVLSAYVSARGHTLTTSLNIGGGKRIRVQNAYLKSQGRVLRIEGHRHNYFTDDVTVEGVFHCNIPRGVTLVQPPILLRNNTLQSGKDRDLRDATIRGRLVLTGRGSIVAPDDTSEHSAKGCFLMVGSCTGTVLLDGITMDTDGREDVIPIGVGSTGSVAQVVIRDMQIRAGDRPCLAAWKGDVHVRGGASEHSGREAHSAIWSPPGTTAVYRIQGFDAGRRPIRLEHGEGHAVIGCIAADVAVPGGTAAGNVAIG